MTHINSPASAPSAAHPAYLVGYPPLTPVTDAAPVGDYDTGYHPPLVRKPVPATGAWLPGDDPGEREFASIGPVELELGGRIPDVTLAYETWGTLNADGTNAVLLCHALTGDSHATSKDGTDGWWHDIVGPGKAIDTDRWYVVCPNVLGGCQGSTGPASIAPDGKPWGSRWPEITIRDMCYAEKRLADQLGITRWALVAGASFGGNRVMEWAASYPQMTGAIAVLVSAAATTAEQIAYAKTQIQAVQLDPFFNGGDYYSQPDNHGPHRGLGLARELAHITYRCPTEFDERFGRTPQEGEDPLAGGRYAVSSYLDHHAYKLALRFDANSYIAISQSMITHDIGRGRGGTAKVVASLTMPALVVAVDTDRLFYPRDVEALADALPGSGPAVYVTSDYGHDGFLIENDQVTRILRDFLDDQERFTD
ncbi:homoserine O-acetyltransferase MetX [Trueperella bialowiezensis]|uniref:Homoserine O-acetyltransferase n=1 Tax=Trueperella bialowiezensis TaxID=312285 RepID=A0A448PFC2_9ACTO|nr:homoserine O-acetyltransferase [Trueperella bialowiezensis]VEI13645.1 Homoserine O-acetyltransferase [Trueperella bialowiezensis]